MNAKGLYHIVAVSIALFISCLSDAVLASDRRPRVVEVTIAAPDMLAVVVRDPEFLPGRLISVPPISAKPGAWVRHEGSWGRVVGPNRDHFRATDTPPASHLDRDAIDAAPDYGLVGNRRVIQVYRKSVPYDSGSYLGNSGKTFNGASFQHFVYLKLDGPLPRGEHQIGWPRSELPPTRFTSNDSTMRAIGLRVNQNGYAPNDTRKIAYLSLWLPGGPERGVLDFHSFGLRTFEIVDSGGLSVYSGPITLRREPDDPESGTGLGSPLVEYPNAAAPAVKVRAVAFENSAKILTGSGQGSSGGTRWRLEGFSGRLAHLNGNHNAKVEGGDRIVLVHAAVPRPVWAPSELGSVRPLITTNRAGTKVYELDFGAWAPTADGDYHIRVPGLGISDRFRVASDTWLAAARVAFAGLYHHRSGIALDGRFGTTRPAGFRPGSHVTIMQSKLPLIWTSNFWGGPLPFGAGANAPWVAADAVGSELWGGYMDAGDWDRRIQHLEIASGLMDLYEHAGPAARAPHLSIPKSHEVLDSALYDEIAHAPDLLHEIAWGLDFYRRLQLADGSVRGGIESAEHPRAAEPSFLESLPVFAYAPDHVSTYRYAAIAARFARILDAESHTGLAALFRASALNAWRAAEVGYLSPDTFYAASLAAAFSAKALDEKSWRALRDTLRPAEVEHRAGAAGALFRLTGETGYRDVFEAIWKTGLPLQLSAADGAWEYSHAPGSDADHVKEIRRRFQAEALRMLRPMAEATYPSLKNPDLPAGWGQGLVPDSNVLQLVLRAHLLSGDPAFIEALQRTSAHILGANQVGLSFTTGLGHRNIRHPLHEDHRAMGTAAPIGITIYGWAPQSMTDHDWIFGHAWAPLPDNATQENGDRRRVEPNRFTLPYFEYLLEHPSLIMQQEYTVHQSIGPTAVMWMYLHAHSVRTAGRMRAH